MALSILLSNFLLMLSKDIWNRKIQQTVTSADLQNDTYYTKKCSHEMPLAKHKDKRGHQYRTDL